MYKTAENPSASSIRVEQEVPPGNADVSLTAKMAEAGGNRMLLLCFFGIFVCYFVYGVLQETMWVIHLSKIVVPIVGYQRNSFKHVILTYVSGLVLSSATGSVVHMFLLTQWQIHYKMCWSVFVGACRWPESRFPPRLFSSQTAKSGEENPVQSFFQWLLSLSLV